MSRSGRARPLRRLLSALALTLALLLTCLTVQAQSDPTAAQNLRAALLPGGGVGLSWDASAEDAESITGYEILRRRPRRGEDTLLSYVGDTGSNATSYTDFDAREPGQQYVYRVVALRGASSSGWSNFARVDVPELDPAEPEPADLAPSNLAVAATDQVAVLSWDTPAAGAATVTGYRVLRSVGGKAMIILAGDAGAGATSYTDASATTPGETYAYQVLALRGAEASQGSNIGSLSPPQALQVPSSTASTRTVDRAPGNLTAAIESGVITLRWDAPTEDGAAATGYQVLRSHAGAALTIHGATTAPQTNYQDHSAARRGMTYAYQVKAWRDPRSTT